MSLTDDFKEKRIEELQAELDERRELGILEEGTYSLLMKLISNADSMTEANDIFALGIKRKRTGLSYEHKLEVITDEIKYLKRNEELSFTTDENAKTHKLIIGENYDALQNLMITHREKINVVYIDPPYGADSMGEFAETNYTNSLSRDNVLSMLHPRLVLARDLMTRDGVIFCSIDDRNQAYIKCLMDEVFGESNFIATLVIASNSSKNNARYIGVSHEYVLCYAKNIAALDVGPTWKVKKNNVDEFIKRAKQLVARGLSSDEIHKELLELVKYPRFYDFDHYTYADKRGVFRLDNPTAPGSKLFYDIIHPITGKPCKTGRRGWARSKEETDKMIAEDRLYFGKDETVCPAPKLYIDEYSYQIPKSVSFFDSQATTKWMKNNGFGFSFPKPINLMKYLISLYPNKDATVLDFFAGSGSTGHAVLDLNSEDGGNRTFILATNNEVEEDSPNGIAYDITIERLHRIMTGATRDGDTNIPHLSDSEPYGDNLEVFEIAEVASNCAEKGKTPFDVIDETCYGLEKFPVFADKADWVCQNFERTCRVLKED